MSERDSIMKLKITAISCNGIDDEAGCHFSCRALLEILGWILCCSQEKLISSKLSFQQQHVSYSVGQNFSENVVFVFIIFLISRQIKCAAQQLACRLNAAEPAVLIRARQGILNGDESGDCEIESCSDVNKRNEPSGGLSSVIQTSLVIKNVPYLFFLHCDKTHASNAFRVWLRSHQQRLHAAKPTDSYILKKEKQHEHLKLLLGGGRGR